MVHLFAPLGFTANLSLAPLRNHPEVKFVHLFYGAPTKPEGKAALREAETTIKTLGLKVIKHRVPHVFDYEQLLASFSEALASLPGQDVLFNASGGTRVMTMAGTIFCIAHDVTMVYYDEYGTQDGAVIPLRAFKSLTGLRTTQRGLLRHLEVHGTTDLGTLAAKLKISASTTSTHVQALHDVGAVRVERQGKRRLVSLDPGLQHLGLGGMQ